MTTLETDKKNRNSRKEIEDIKKNKMENLELKNTSQN